MTYIRVQRLIDRKQPKFCACGNHVWIVLTRGFVSLISPEDVSFLGDVAWQGISDQSRNHYARSRKGRLHNIILGVDLVDHANGNGLDNRRHNIREANKSQNAQNGNNHRGGTSKYKGVSWDKEREKWTVWIKVLELRVFLGRFSLEEAAARAYDAAAIKHFGEFARLNFP